MTLAKFDMYASGEPVKIKFLGFSIALTGVTTSTNYVTVGNFLKNISLTDDAGGQVGSTINTPPTGNSCDATVSPTGTSGTNDVIISSNVTYVDCFGTSGSPINYQIPANTTRVLSLKADIQSLPTPAGFSTITASLLSEANNLQGVISSNTGSTGSAQGSSLSLANSSLTVSRNNALGTQNVSAGVSDQQVGSYTFQAASAEGVNVNNISVAVSSSYFQNLHIMVNGTQFGSTQGTVSGGNTYTFSGTPFNVPVGGSVNVGVYADTLSSGLGLVSPATTLTGCSATGQTSYSSISCNSTTGQNLSFGGSPAITVAADSSEPPAGQIVMGSTGNTLGVYRFSETSNIENVKVTTLNVVDSVVSTTAVKAAFSNLQMWNGSTLLGTAGAPTADAAGTGWIYTFNFGNTPIIVPQANSISVTLKGDAATYSSQGATDASANAFDIMTTSDAYNNTSTLTVVALGNTSNKAAVVTISSANGNTQTVLRSTLALTGSSLTQSSKQPLSEIGTITLTANAAGAITLNHLMLTFSGNGYSTAGSSTFMATVSLRNSNQVDVDSAYGATSSSNVGAGTDTWTFPTSTAPVINAGTSITLQVWAATNVIPAIGSTVESLSAAVQSSGDLQYYDGADSTAYATGLISVPSTAVPVNVVNLTWGQGQ